MAQGPIDYTSGFGQQSPFGGAMEAMQAGARFGVFEQQRAGLQQQQMMREQQMLAAQAERERQGQIGQAVDALIQNPNATRADYDRLAVLMPKDQSAALINAFNARTTEQQGNDLRFAGQIQAALRAGNPAMAQRLLVERADAERNSGQPAQAKQWGTWAQIAETSPDGLRVVVGEILALLPGGGAVLDAISKARTEGRAEAAFVPEQAAREADARIKGANAEFAPVVAQANATEAQAKAVTAGAKAKVADEAARLDLQLTRANIANAQSQVGERAARLRLDADRLALDTTRLLGEIQARAGAIPEFAQRDVNGAAVAAGVATQQATRLNALATELSSLNAWSGAAGSAAEYLKRATGSQNAQTLLRQEYVRMRQSLVSQALPPGAASDKDIALAMEGFLPANADPQAMASFLRGMAKVQTITAEVETARGDWLASNRGSLGRSGQSFQAGRFRTVPGETFAGFTDRVTKELARPPEGSAARVMEQIPFPGTPAEAAARARLNNPPAPAQPAAGAAPAPRSVDDLVRQFAAPTR